jgi:hypothetical protein
MFDFTVSSLFVLSDGLLFAMAQCVKAADLFPEVPGAKRRKNKNQLARPFVTVGRPPLDVVSTRPWHNADAAELICTSRHSCLECFLELPVE